MAMDACLKEALVSIQITILPKMINNFSLPTFLPEMPRNSDEKSEFGHRWK